MKETLKLKKPLLVNGKEVTELTYDADEITIEEYKAASKRSISYDVSIAESDYYLHLQIGFAAILAVNPDVDVADLERLKGRDLYAVSIIGRNFIIEVLGDFESKNSEEPSEITQEPSTPRENSSKH